MTSEDATGDPAAESAEAATSDESTDSSTTTKKKRRRRGKRGGRKNRPKEGEATESSTDERDESAEPEAVDVDDSEAERAEDGDGETTTKKRRRRGRRGGRGRNRDSENGESGEANETNEQNDTVDNGADDTEKRDDAPKPKRERSRGGRGRDGGRDSSRDGGRDRSRGRNDAPQGDYDQDDGVDPNEGQPVKKLNRDLSDKDWEDIYDNQTFRDLGLRESVVKALDDAGFSNPTKIQAELVPLVLSGKDVLGQSRTGTGKTAAFGLPLYHMARRGVPFQTLVLSPTRELAIQITKEFDMIGSHTPIKAVPVYGGQRIPAQVEKLEKEPEIIVATPGRLMDLLERRLLHLNNIRFVVLDEVDRMLDIGFRDDIRKILSRIKGEHQTVFVSATISDEIEALSKKFMKDPEKLVMTSGSLTVQLVDQSYLAVEPWDKKRLLPKLLKERKPELAIVFCRMKRTVDKLVMHLERNKIHAMGIHGDLYQSKRNAVMEKLRSGELKVVVASDLAARGLDVDGITHVINYDLPEDPEVYIHRIGRTARAGRRGEAISFVSPDQGPLLTDIEQLANAHIPEITLDGFEPGPVPDDIAMEKKATEKKIAAKQSMNRFALSNSIRVSEKDKVDTSKFPGGIVPTKMPPKKMQGRVLTTRTIKKMADAPAPDAKPDET